MKARGHIGLAFLVVFGIYTLFHIKGTGMLELGIFIVAFSTLPDIGIKLEIAHRKYIHNIMAGIIFEIIIGILLYYIGLGFLEGFIAGFGGTLIHILGDIFTYMKFKSLAPFSQAEIGLGLFRANDPVINKLLLIIGVMMFATYLLFIY